MTGARYVRTEGIPFRTIGDEVLLAIPGRDDVLYLEGSTRAVWVLLGEPTAIPEIVAALARDYDTPRASLRRDLAKLLDQLIGEGAIRRVGSGHG